MIPLLCCLAGLQQRGLPRIFTAFPFPQGNFDDSIVVFPGRIVNKHALGFGACSGAPRAAAGAGFSFQGQTEEISPPASAPYPRPHESSCFPPPSAPHKFSGAGRCRIPGPPGPLPPNSCIHLDSFPPSRPRSCTSPA